MKPPRYQVQRRLSAPASRWRTLAESDFMKVARGHYAHHRALTIAAGVAVAVRLIDTVTGEVIEPAPRRDVAT